MARIKDTVSGNLNRLGKINPDPIIRDIADETLRLSVQIVPHDEGTLEKSGNADKLGNAHYRVGYNTDYAAKLHENPQFNFQKGRQGKYLENPIKNNLDRFRRYARDQFKKEMQRRIK